MKCTIRLILMILTLVALTASGFSQTQAEQFITAVVDYKKSSTNENALKVIELFKQIDPPPVVPEEAREPWVMANTMLKKSADRAGAVKAVDLYTKAIAASPWFADAYYNRALAREAAGQFEQAIADLKLFLAFKLSEAERREAQDKIYALKADAQLDAVKKAEQDKVIRAEDEKRQAEQAKRDVIAQIKMVVGNRSYVVKIPSYGRNPKDVWGGVTQNELFGGGTYYIFEYGNGTGRPFWKFFDERFELWIRDPDGREFAELVGESWGPKITDMRWFRLASLDTKVIKMAQVWARFDLWSGYLYASNWGPGAMWRPVNNSQFDPNRRYGYVMYYPAK